MHTPLEEAIVHRNLESSISTVGDAGIRIPRARRRAKATRLWLIAVVFAICLGLVLIFLAFSVGDTSRVLTNQADPFPSKALGLSKSAWEQRHKLTTTIPGQGYIYDYMSRDGKAEYGSDGFYHGYQVRFWSEGEPVYSASPISIIGGYVPFILSDLGDSSSILPSVNGEDKVNDPDGMLRAARALMPEDAEFQKIGLGGSGWSTIATYRSKSLANRYSPLPSVPNPWGSEPPGTILVRYRPDFGSVSVMAVLVNPPAPTSVPWVTNTPEILPGPTEPYVPPPRDTPPRPVATVSAP